MTLHLLHLTKFYKETSCNEKFFEILEKKRQNAVTSVMNFQKKWDCYTMVVYWILNYLLHWLDFICWRKELFTMTFCFCIIIMKRRKLTTIFWEISICFYLVVENCLFLVNICLCGASNCLNHFTFFLQNSERCNQSASDSFALFDEISQNTSANQRWETEDLFACIFDCIWWSKQLFGKTFGFLHHCNEEQKIDP